MYVLESECWGHEPKEFGNVVKFCLVIGIGGRGQVEASRALGALNGIIQWVTGEIAKGNQSSVFAEVFALNDISRPDIGFILRIEVVKGVDALNSVGCIGGTFGLRAVD